MFHSSLPAPQAPRQTASWWETWNPSLIFPNCSNSPLNTTPGLFTSLSGWAQCTWWWKNPFPIRAHSQLENYLPFISQTCWRIHTCQEVPALSPWGRLPLREPFWKGPLSPSLWNTVCRAPPNTSCSQAFSQWAARTRLVLWRRPKWREKIIIITSF